MMRRKTPNPKRRVRAEPVSEAELQGLQQLALRVSYGGNPEHKRNPGDFGLDPPSMPRQGKSLCDEAKVTSKKQATSLLRKAVQRGLISVQERQGWPQNVWAVSENGTPLEAMLENRASGVYHGYPMQEDDPLADEVIQRWSD